MTWYTELYDCSNNRPKSYALLAEFSSVRNQIRQRKPGEIVRIIAPVKASVNDLEELRALGARPF